MPKVARVTVPKTVAQILFDALTSSLDFGSGFLDTEEVEALRALAVILEVDPNLGTPSEFRAQYPHAFDGETNPERVAWMTGARNDAQLPEYAPCKVGSYGHKCLKPDSDPVHQVGGPDA